MADPRRSTDPCPVCGGRDARLLYGQRFRGLFLPGYDVVVCDRCGLGYADGLPPQEAFDSYYAELSKYEFEDTDGVQSPHDLKRFAQAIELLVPALPDRSVSILEIGCSTGGLLGGLKALGFENLTGADPSPACAAAVRRKYGLEAVSGAVSSLAFGERKFDVVILMGAMEHFRDLSGVTAKIAGFLKPGGLFYVEVPDALRFDAFDDAPFQEFSIEHILYFSPVSLENHLRVSGFSPLWTAQNDRRYSSSTIMPNISTLCRFTGEKGEIVRDTMTGPALGAYVETSKGVEERITGIIDGLAGSGSPLIVWGVGTHTQRLLASTDFSRMNIRAFVDSNPRYHGREFSGVPVVPPTALGAMTEPILISSRVFQREISAQIRSLYPEKRIITLYDLGGETEPTGGAR